MRTAILRGEEERSPRAVVYKLNRPSPPDLLADIMSLVTPLILCAVLLVIIDPFGCRMR